MLDDDDLQRIAAVISPLHAEMREQRATSDAQFRTLAAEFAAVNHRIDMVTTSIGDFWR